MGPLVVAFVAALVNLVFGTIVAWVLVRYSFPGRDLADALVDLPFALPTAGSDESSTATTLIVQPGIRFCSFASSTAS